MILASWYLANDETLHLLQGANTKSLTNKPNKEMNVTTYVDMWLQIGITFCSIFNDNRWHNIWIFPIGKTSPCHKLAKL